MILQPAWSRGGCQMVKSIYRWLLLSWPILLIHRASRGLHKAYFREFDPFGEFSGAGAKLLDDQSP
jgi:hypothetical protein